MWTGFWEFLFVSLPEQFLMALFVWVILGRRESIRFRNVLVVGFSVAIMFFVTKELLDQNYLATVPQVIAFLLIFYSCYRLNLFEAIIGSLITFVVFLAIQGTIVNIVGLFTGITEKEVISNFQVRVLVLTFYCSITALLTYFLYTNNISIYFLSNKKADKLQTGRMRFLTLQLTFALGVMSINYIIFLRNIEVFTTITDKVLLFSSVFVTIFFTIFLVRSVFKMGEIIQKEEEQKRQMDGREIIQNIEYLYTLIDEKKYDELEKILRSMKNDVNAGMVNNKSGSNK